MTSLSVLLKKALISAKSASLSSAPFFTQRVSPTMLIFSVKACCCSCVLVTSERIFPSFNSMIRSPYISAKSRSCDTTITSFSLESFFKVSNTCLPVAESKAPVGSSAMIISGDFTKALAIAIRCFCPPDKVFGLRFAKPVKSTCSSKSAITFLSFGLPCNSNAKAILSSTVNSLRILYSWKMNPTYVFR